MDTDLMDTTAVEGIRGGVGIIGGKTIMTTTDSIIPVSPYRIFE